MIAVTCGSVQIADKQIEQAYAEFQQALSRGQVGDWFKDPWCFFTSLYRHLLKSLPFSFLQFQVLSTDLLKLERVQELIYLNIRYKVRVVRIGPTRYGLVMNDSYTEVRRAAVFTAALSSLCSDIPNFSTSSPRPTSPPPPLSLSVFPQVDLRRLADGSSLIRFGDNSYVTYMKEEVSHYRIVVGGRTCIFEKERDPSICRTTTTGKLLRYIVPDGAHVRAGESIAEVCNRVHFSTNSLV